MKKILSIIIFLFCAISSFAQFPNNTSVSNAQTIYHIKGAVKGDESTMITIKDTLNNPATVYPGAMTIRPQDTIGHAIFPIYQSNGTFWSKVSSSSIIIGLGVDSVTLYGNQLCQWQANVATCYFLTPSTGSAVDSFHLNYDSLYILQYRNGALIDSIFLLHTYLYVDRHFALDPNYLSNPYAQLLRPTWLVDSVYASPFGSGFNYVRYGNGNIDSVPASGSVTGVITWSVLDSLSTPSVTPSDGDKYLVGTSPTDDFVGHANEIATYHLAGLNYTFQSATIGDLLYDAKNGVVSKWTGSVWVWVGKLVLHQGGEDASYGNVTFGSKGAFQAQILANDIVRAYVDPSTGNFIEKTGVWADNGGLKLYNGSGTRYLDALDNFTFRLDGLNTNQFTITHSLMDLIHGNSVAIEPSGSIGHYPFIFSANGDTSFLGMGNFSTQNVNRYAVIKGNNWNDVGNGKPMNLLMYGGTETGSGNKGNIFLAHDGSNPFGSVGVGTITPVTSSIFNVASTTLGSIPSPRMTAAQRLAIGSPATGLMVFDTDSACYFNYTGSAWVSLCRTGSGGSGSSLANFYLKDSTLSSERTVDLGGFPLHFVNSGNWFDIDPTAGFEKIELNVLGSESGASTFLTLNNNSDNGNKFNLVAQSATENVGITGNADAQTFSVSAGGYNPISIDIPHDTMALRIIHPSGAESLIKIGDDGSPPKVTIGLSDLPNGQTAEYLFQAGGANLSINSATADQRNVSYSINSGNIQEIYQSTTTSSTMSRIVGINTGDHPVTEITATGITSGQTGQLIVTDTSININTPILRINGVEYSAGSGGTVTSVAALTLTTSGTDLTSSVANSTTTPVITLNVPSASASNRGVLTASDWSAFSGKQAALNGTGLLSFSGTTPAYNTTSASISNIISDELGTGKMIFSAGTLDVASGKTLTSSNTLTLAGTDGSTLNVGTGGTLGTNAYTSTAYLPLAGGTMSGAITVNANNTLDLASSATAFKSGYFATSIVDPLLSGSISSGGNLTFQSTTHGTKGFILFGISGYDEVNNRLGIGTTTLNNARMTVNGTVTAGTFATQVAPNGGLQWGMTGTGNLSFYTNGSEKLTISSAGTLAAAGTMLPRAGTATASTAPLKFTAGTLLSSPEAGTVEYVTGKFVLQNDWLGIGTTPIKALDVVASVSAGSIMKIQNTSASGYSSFDVYSSGGTNMMGFGYGNASVAAPLADRAFIFTNNKDFGVSVDLTSTLGFIVKAAGNVGIGQLTPAASAKLDIVSTTQGLLIPRMTTTQMNAISSPATGLKLYNTTSGTEYAYNGTAYASVGTISGSFSQVGAATTVFTVTFGGTQPNTTYKVNVVPTAILSAAAFYVTNKTTTTFDVTYIAGLTGTVTFDWSLFQ